MGNKKTPHEKAQLRLKEKNEGFEVIRRIEK